MSQTTNQIHLNQIENKINEIRKAFEIIANSLPINSDKFVEMFYDLTQCEINYDLFPRIEKTEKLSESIELRAYVVHDRVYCIENGMEKEYIVNAKVIDVFDAFRTIAYIMNYKVFSIELNR